MCDVGAAAASLNIITTTTTTTTTAPLAGAGSRQKSPEPATRCISCFPCWYDAGYHLISKSVLLPPPPPPIDSAASTFSENKRNIAAAADPLHAYTLRELSRATGHFRERNKIGEGSFGTVYYGRHSRGNEIAVKRLVMKTNVGNSEEEFRAEVEILGKLWHKNLLCLRGFCVSGAERLIVYDYMPQRSLSSHLHGRISAAGAVLRWPLRVKIAVGVAEGLQYLHAEAEPHIIHRDVKPSNILLDAEFNPKVADFGFAKLMVPSGGDESMVTTRVKGTVGYMAPEYAMWGRVSESCDVYSFGVVLLVLVSGRKAIDRNAAEGASKDVVLWASAAWAVEKVESLADPRLGGAYDAGELRRLVAVALRCTDPYLENRPAMDRVVEMLKGSRHSGGVEEEEIG